MQLSEAKTYHQLGLLNRAIVTRSLLHDMAWCIEFRSDRPVDELTLEAARGGARVFRTLDSAAATLRDIGFIRFEVDAS